MGEVLGRPSAHLTEKGEFIRTQMRRSKRVGRPKAALAKGYERWSRAYGMQPKVKLSAIASTGLRRSKLRAVIVTRPGGNRRRWGMSWSQFNELRVIEGKKPRKRFTLDAVSGLTRKL